jgi:hypothetical protein
MRTGGHISEEERLRILHDIGILHSSVVVLLLFQKLFVLLLLSLKLRIKNLTHFIHSLEYKDAFALGTCFRLAYE